MVVYEEMRESNNMLIDVKMANWIITNGQFIKNSSDQKQIIMVNDMNITVNLINDGRNIRAVKQS